MNESLESLKTLKNNSFNFTAINQKLRTPHIKYVYEFLKLVSLKVRPH